MAVADPCVTSHAIGRVTILYGVLDSSPDALARGNKGAGGTGDHQAAELASSKATPDGSHPTMRCAKNDNYRVATATNNLFITNG